MKPEFKSLIDPGFTEVTVSDLDTLFVQPFTDQAKRKHLYERLSVFLYELSKFNVPCEIWVDGSFTTEKPEPEDIDMAIFFDPTVANSLSDEEKKALSILVHNPIAKHRYKCDVYFVPNNNEERRSYWRGWFCFTRTEKPKGVARIKI